MHGQTNKVLLHRRTQRKLRKSMTDAELRLWRYLRHCQVSGFKFRRQHPFGDYILDFVCLDAKLIVEVDGGQHAVVNAADEARTQQLTRAGFRLLRFWNNDVLNNMDGVWETICCALNDRVNGQGS